MTAFGTTVFQNMYGVKLNSTSNYASRLTRQALRFWIRGIVGSKRLLLGKLKKYDSLCMRCKNGLEAGRILAIPKKHMPTH
eukprot:316590-Amphidinium_carterae.1